MSTDRELPTDDEILDELEHMRPTYVVKNALKQKGFAVDTSWVRRRLMRLESYGRVRRVSGLYASQITWKAVRPVGGPA